MPALTPVWPGPGLALAARRRPEPTRHHLGAKAGSAMPLVLLSFQTTKPTACTGLVLGSGRIGLIIRAAVSAPDLAGSVFSLHEHAGEHVALLLDSAHLVLDIGNHGLQVGGLLCFGLQETCHAGQLLVKMFVLPAFIS